MATTKTLTQTFTKTTEKPALDPAAKKYEEACYRKFNAARSAQVQLPATANDKQKAIYAEYRAHRQQLLNAYITAVWPNHPSQGARLDELKALDSRVKAELAQAATPELAPVYVTVDPKDGVEAKPAPKIPTKTSPVAVPTVIAPPTVTGTSLVTGTANVSSKSGIDLRPIDLVPQLWLPRLLVWGHVEAAKGIAKGATFAWDKGVVPAYHWTGEKLSDAKDATISGVNSTGSWFADKAKKAKDGVVGAYDYVTSKRIHVSID